MFPETKSRETLRFEGNKIHCSPRDQSLSDLLYSKANGSSRWKTNNHVFDKCLRSTRPQNGGRGVERLFEGGPGHLF